MIVIATKDTVNPRGKETAKGREVTIDNSIADEWLDCDFVKKSEVPPPFATIKDIEEVAAKDAEEQKKSKTKSK